VDRLQQLASQSPGDPQVRGVADAIGARLALARLDTAGAVEQLRRVRSMVPRQTLWWGIREPYALERLLLARLLAATGRSEEALGVVQVLGHHGPVTFLPLLQESLALHAELSARLGRADAAQYSAMLRSIATAGSRDSN
jgi:hypothetical protein